MHFLSLVQFVLTGLWDGQYDQIIRWCISKPRSGIDIDLDSVAYCSVLLPLLPCYSSPHLSYHMSPFSNPGVTRICPRISAYSTRSSAHPGVSHLHPSILNFRSSSPYSPGSYWVALSPRRLLLFSSRDISVKFSLCCFSDASWCHRASLLRTPPLISLLSCAHFKDRSQRHPLFHGCLSSPYVGHIRLHYCLFPH